MPRFSNDSSCPFSSYLPKKRLQLVRPATIVSAALNSRVKKSASAVMAFAGMASILASFHWVPSNGRAFCCEPPQAVIAPSSTAAAKIFFIILKIVC